MLVAVYSLFVYDDGHVELKQTKSSSVVCTEGASSSIRQIVRVIEYVANNPGTSIRRSVNNGINSVAKRENITSSSVHAKVLRKLDLSMKEFKNLVENYLEGNDNQLESVLRNSCVARTKAADDAAIEQLFELIAQKKQNSVIAP